MRIWHLTSLDAPTVAVVWSLAFAWAAGIVLPSWLPLLLALVTWTVYIADRLLDARAALRAGTTHRLRQRHLFHWRHRRILVPLALAAFFAALAMVIALMPATIRERNTVLAAATLVYFTRVHSLPRLLTRRRPASSLLLSFRFPSKELLVALLFTAACALPVFSRLPAANAASPLAATVAFFSLLAFVNCHAIERWECATSGHSVSGSDFSRAAATAKSPRALTAGGRTLQVPATNTTFSLAIFLGLFGLLTAALLFPSHPRPAALLVTGAAGALLIALLDRSRNRLTPLALRTAADLVLLFPFALLVR